MAKAANDLASETGVALRRQYESDLADEAACVRACTAAQHDLMIARQRRLVAERAYRLDGTSLLVSRG